ncbi:hypothetical protein BJ165DRAFT_1561251 [Panaeolus papilionaceus]|nr:hypothetical protein BJ165DRAFT_1561251 [Panaeolus papilionaceus]
MAELDTIIVDVYFNFGSIIVGPEVLGTEVDYSLRRASLYTCITTSTVQMRFANGNHRPPGDGNITIKSLTAKESRCYHPRLRGGIQIFVTMLASSSPRWHADFPQGATILVSVVNAPSGCRYLVFRGGMQLFMRKLPSLFTSSYENLPFILLSPQSKLSLHRHLRLYFCTVAEHMLTRQGDKDSYLCISVWSNRLRPRIPGDNLTNYSPSYCSAYRLVELVLEQYILSIFYLQAFTKPKEQSSNEVILKQYGEVRLPQPTLVTFIHICSHLVQRVHVHSHSISPLLFVQGFRIRTKMYGYTVHGVIGAALALISTSAVLYSLHKLFLQQDVIQTQQERLLKQQESLLKQQETQQVDNGARITALRDELGDVGVTGQETGETLRAMGAVVEELKEMARVEAQSNKPQSDAPGRSTPSFLPQPHHGF